MHDNDNSSNSNIVDNDSNCLHDSSDSNESFSFLNGTNTQGDSKVVFNGLNGCKFYYNSSQDKKEDFESPWVLVLSLRKEEDSLL